MAEKKVDVEKKVIYGEWLESKDESWIYEKVGDNIEGTLVGVIAFQGLFGEQKLFQLSNTVVDGKFCHPDTILGVYGTSILTRRMSPVKVGYRVKIEFLGLKGKAKDFKVQYQPELF